ncbi:DNA/RNA non-specific endonuclease [Psychrobacter sanguinis]|uniref:DNA/RNA non-specific endonuclease n=1 Tax=Psychrobacter sanguinis TaxID=861445 RepID=UPI001D1364F2|nr:DNA/RNA non-specific endonuclease [Psychrobacter sanguinis]MCC3307669.1 DNA/RNA non-specific endonuclease [Psychrobacter sanguinis]UEC26940.1 DNA/RNA non-specific endonuclease [Psychrobacter sanguinis]
MSNGHKYITNSKGRINKFKVELSLNKIDRNTNRQRNAGKAENATGDDSGHLIASKLGVAGYRLNMVPQASTLNRGNWKRMENEVRNEFKAGKSVSIKIDLDYANSSSSRPSKFIVNIKVDGKAKSPYIFEQ